MLELFDYYRSSASYRVRIALNYKAIPHKLTHVNLIDEGGQHLSEKFSKINPQQLVPTLRVDQEHIHQSLAILEYLEQVYPKCPLLPKEPISIAKVKSFCLEIACEIHPLNNLRVLKYLKADLGIDDIQKTQWYFHWLEQGFKSLSQQISPNGPFCFGEKLTWADLFLIPQIYNAHRFNFDMSGFSKLQNIYDHCLTLDYFQKATPEQRLFELQ
jgi:maleylacetoacetate isomerase